MADKIRIEKDSLGEVRIPAQAYWGTTTQRALECYPISGLTHHPKFIDAYVMLKQAAAMANKDSKALKPKIANAIIKACKEILNGELREQFVVDVFQMGAGTSFHMNVNEVIANRANEILGGKIGDNSPVTANDHVNFGQSTNDTFPTAMRLGILLMLRDHLHKPLIDLEAAFAKKGKEFDKIVKSARTHLQDAVPIRLGQEFAAYGEAIKRCHKSIASARDWVKELGIGGSAAGTGLNTAKGYREALLVHLKKISKINDLKLSPNMCEAMQSQRPITEISAALRNLAIEVSRICNDLRLLSSGPTTGLFEIQLPSIAPGSSIMPGKVNPSMLECANMVCFEVIGNDTAVSWAVGAGQLELNVMMPLMQHKVISSIHVMGSLVRQLTDLCVKGIKANPDRCQRYVEGSMGLATALNVYVGYKNASMVAKESLKSGKTLIEVTVDKGLMKEEELRKVLDLHAMTKPGIPGK
ncbi:aspartate ammonia-lyase [bacterium]|nr:aspartate ammonia-lyase [bacterium]